MIPVVGSTATGARVASRTGGLVVDSYRAVDGTTIDIIQRNGVEFAAVKGPDGSISLEGKADELGDGLAGARIVAYVDPEALILSFDEGRRFAPRAAVALDLMQSGDPRHWAAAERLVSTND